MPSLNFETHFAPLILSGIKTSTIRVERKRPIVKGDRLHLFTGMRTKNCRKLGVATCVSANPVEIHPDKGVLLLVGGTPSMPQITRAPMDQAKVAFKEGFEGAEEMMAWFGKRYDLPILNLQWIHWKFEDLTVNISEAAAALPGDEGAGEGKNVESGAEGEK